MNSEVPYGIYLILIGWSIVALLGLHWTRALWLRAREGMTFWGAVREMVRLRTSFLYAVTFREFTLVLFAVDAVEVWLIDPPPATYLRVTLRLMYFAAFARAWWLWLTEPVPTGITNA